MGVASCVPDISQRGRSDILDILRTLPVKVSLRCGKIKANTLLAVYASLPYGRKKSLLR